MRSGIKGGTDVDMLCSGCGAVRACLMLLGLVDIALTVFLFVRVLLLPLGSNGVRKTF